MKHMWNTVECKRDSFSGALGKARETHTGCVFTAVSGWVYTYFPKFASLRPPLSGFFHLSRSPVFPFFLYYLAGWLMIFSSGDIENQNSWFKSLEEKYYNLWIGLILFFRQRNHKYCISFFLISKILLLINGKKNQN